MRERNYNIDILKAFAIISVITIHTLTWQERLAILAPYHIWQAMPLFMLIYGYNYAKSAQSKGRFTLNALYQWPVIKRRLWKIIGPFLLVVLIRMIIDYLINGGINWITYFLGVFIGNFGHGGYFIPLVIQSILIIPLIYHYMQKNLKANTIILLVFTLALDWLVQYLGLPDGIYRLLIIRYLFVIVLGAWLAMTGKKLNFNILGLLAGISLIYITAVYYFDFQTSLETLWQAQHGPAYFWILFVVAIVLSMPNAQPDKAVNRLFIRIGQDSYFIYLAQMVYIWLERKADLQIWSPLHLLINIVICVLLGIFFRKSYRFLSQKG